MEKFNENIQIDLLTENKLKSLETQLETYKNTLTDIYDLYDQKIEELSLVRRLGDVLRTPLDFKSLSYTLLKVVSEVIPVDRLSLLLYDNNAKLKKRAAYWTVSEKFIFYPTAKGLNWEWPAAPPLKSKEPLTVINAHPSQDPLGESKEEEARSLLFLPLIARHKEEGFIALSRLSEQAFVPAEERILAIMGDQAATAVANVLLFDDLNQANLMLSKSEYEARQASLYLESLLEAANDVIFTLGVKGEITQVNQQVARWGWLKEELVGKLLRELLVLTLNDETDWPLGSPPKAGSILGATLKTALGERREVLLSSSEVFQVAADLSAKTSWGGGVGPSFLVMVSDLTEVKQLERQLFHSEKLASIGLLAAGVAHEVGNPLSAISGYTQILLANQNADKNEQKEYLLAIEEQSNRIQKILKELLNYSRPAQGVGGIVDLGESLPQVLGMLSTQRAFKQLEIVYDFSENQAPFLVMMDKDHLAQIVIIIALNAAQSLNGLGTLTIHLEKYDDVVVLKMADNGPGMRAEVRQKVFEPFYTTKNPGQGTGLGLAICQRLVDTYKGQIYLQSIEGQGTTLTITLPQANIT